MYVLTSHPYKDGCCSWSSSSALDVMVLVINIQVDMGSGILQV
jgi:hypothetical protein